MGSFYQQPQQSNINAHYQYHQYGSGYNNYTYNPYQHYGNYYGYNYSYNLPQKPEFDPARSYYYSVSTALAIPSIINQILKHTSLPDLKRLRQTSHQWNEESSKIIRQRLSIQFNSCNSIKSFCGFRKNLCKSFSLGPSISLQMPIVQQFILDFGPWINAIEIQCNSLKINDLQNVIFECLPNLEHLVLSTEISDEDDVSEQENKNVVLVPFLPNLKTLKLQRSLKTQKGAYKSIILQIITSAPNLEEIGAFGKPCDNSLIKSYASNDIKPDDVNEILDQSHSLDEYLWSTLFDTHNQSNDIYLPVLRKIKLDKKLSMENIQMITSKEFPLKCLDLFIQPDVTHTLLQDLFNSVKGTLTKIKLKFDGLRPDHELDLSLGGEKFPLVESIELEEYKGSLKFIEGLPNISELILRRVNLNKVVLKDADGPPKTEGIMKSLKTLKIYEDYSKNQGTHKQRSIQTVQKLGQQFPSLKNLRLERLVDESLCLIYAQWSSLEELEIVEGLFTDSGTTAIHPNAYMVILREEAYELFNMEALRQGLFLGNLSKLTTLKIHSPFVTDVTMILGVLKCPKIRSVSVNSNKITDTALFRLIKNPNLTHLETENCYKLSEEAIIFAKRKLKERGGQAKINEYKGPLDVFKVRDFLRRNPKPNVILKRLGTTSTASSISSCSISSKKEHKPKNSIKQTLNEKPMPKSMKMKMKMKLRSQRNQSTAEEEIKTVPKVPKQVSIVTKCTIDLTRTNIPRIPTIDNEMPKLEKMEPNPPIMIRQPRRCASIFKRF